MKKLLYLFIASAILISCESDNDTDLDPIIGTWQLQSVSKSGNEQTTECERKTTLVFLENGTTTNERFFEDGNGCELEKGVSTWVNKGNSTYRIDKDTEDAKLNFSQNNTIFTSSIITEDLDVSGNIVSVPLIITYKKI